MFASDVRYLDALSWEGECVYRFWAMPDLRMDVTVVGVVIVIVVSEFFISSYLSLFCLNLYL